MKKIIVITFYLFFIASHLSAQSRCEKGTWVFGLSPVEYSVFSNSKSSNYTADTLADTQKSKSNGGLGVGYSISAGYFIRDNFCIGAGWGGVSLFAVIPTILFARYYLMQKKRCFSFTHQDNTKRSAFFVQGYIAGYYSVGGNSDNSNYSNNNTLLSESKSAQTHSYQYGAAAAAGYTYMFARHAAFEIMIKYYYSNSGNESKGGWNYDACKLNPNSFNKKH